MKLLEFAGFAVFAHCQKAAVSWSLQTILTFNAVSGVEAFLPACFKTNTRHEDFAVYSIPESKLSSLVFTEREPHFCQSLIIVLHINLPLLHQLQSQLFGLI